MSCVSGEGWGREGGEWGGGDNLLEAVSQHLAAAVAAATAYQSWSWLNELLVSGAMIRWPSGL